MLCRERGHRPPRPHPPRHHRQGRGDPSGTEIGYNLAEDDRKRYWVSEGGIVVIPKRAKFEIAE